MYDGIHIDTERPESIIPLTRKFMFPVIDRDAAAKAAAVSDAINPFMYPTLSIHLPNRYWVNIFTLNISEFSRPTCVADNPNPFPMYAFRRGNHSDHPILSVSDDIYSQVKFLLGFRSDRILDILILPFFFVWVSTPYMVNVDTPMNTINAPRRNVVLYPVVSARYPASEGANTLARKNMDVTRPTAAPNISWDTDSASRAPLTGCPPRNENLINVYAISRNMYWGVSPTMSKPIDIAAPVRIMNGFLPYVSDSIPKNGIMNIISRLAVVANSPILLNWYPRYTR